jgi:hypothetical protein
MKLRKPTLQTLHSTKPTYLTQNLAKISTKQPEKGESEQSRTSPNMPEHHPNNTEQAIT